MRSSAEVLEGNKVKITVEVDEDELRSAVDDTMRRLQREVNVPGFRPGKVPRKLLEVRLGGKMIREEVLRHAVPDYYAQAVEDAELDIIAAPEIDITAGEEEGPLSFDAVVEVRPKVGIPGYDGLRVTVTSPEPTDEEVEAQIDRLREQFAELKDVKRAVKDRDLVTLDITGVRGEDTIDELSSTDFVYEVGSGGLIEGADAKLHAAKVGDIVEVDAEDAPGGPAKIRLLVKSVREKVLPKATDEWAGDASEFDTIEELRDDLRNRLRAFKRLQSNLELREKAVEALAALVVEDMPETLVKEESQRLQHGLVHRLADSKISLDQYLEARSTTVDGLVAELDAQGAVQVRADLALRALSEMENLQVSDDELAGEIARVAAESNRSVREVARQIAEGAGLERLRSELRNSKAVAWLVEHVEVVDEEGRPIDRALLIEPATATADEEDADTTAKADAKPKSTKPKAREKQAAESAEAESAEAQSTAAESKAAKAAEEQDESVVAEAVATESAADDDGEESED